MNTLTYYWNSFTGYWPTARALSASVVSACFLFLTLLSVPIRSHLSRRQPRKIPLFVGGRWIPFFVRDGTDISALREIFVGEEYLFDSLPVIAPVHVADVGAHIGSSVLYFHQVYPDAIITAYEPDPDNFKLLTMNVGSLSQVECVNAAVAGAPGTLLFYPNVGGSTRSSLKQVSDSGEGISVTAVSFEDVVSRGADFVKFDTEGAEYDTFSMASPKSIKKVGRYVGEVHHKLIGKTRGEFERLFPEFSFVWKDRGNDHSIVAISRE
jgi:FkbM family methyltransferase